eukprot:5411136-Lingulodinium_polyedra.AAC.1
MVYCSKSSGSARGKSTAPKDQVGKRRTSAPPPAERGDPVRDPVRDRDRPTDADELLPLEVAGSLESHHQLFAEQPLADFHGQRVASAGQVDVQFLAALQGVEGALHI